MTAPVVVLTTSWDGDGVSVTPLTDGVFEVAYDPGWTTEGAALDAVCWLLGETVELPERGAA